MALLKENFEVYILCPPGDYKSEMVSWGCKYIDTNLDRRGKNVLNEISLFKFYIKMLRKIKPNIVLTYTIKPNLYGGLACRLLNIPCINNITGLGTGFNSGKFLKAFLISFYKISFKKSALVFFQNRKDMETILENRIVKGRYKLIPGSGVNLKDFKFTEYPIGKNPVKFLYMGRVMKDKGIDEFLEAAKIIKDKYKNTKFYILGFIEKSQDHYRNLLKDYQSKGYIEYLGYQSDVKSFIEESHCLIQPSHSEGLSNVLLEAAAMGRPLIASNINGCKETIDEGKNGFTFEVNNSKDLANKIEKFIKLSYEEKITMGKNSRIKVENEFDRKIVVNSYLNAIKDKIN